MALPATRATGGTQRRVATALVRWLGRHLHEPKVALDGYGQFDLTDTDHLRAAR